MNHIRMMGLTGRQGRATRGDYVIIADYCHYCGHPQAATAAAKAAGDGKKIKTELETDRQIKRERAIWGLAKT